MYPRLHPSVWPHLSEYVLLLEALEGRNEAGFHLALPLILLLLLNLLLLLLSPLLPQGGVHQVLPHAHSEAPGATEGAK